MVDIDSISSGLVLNNDGIWYASETQNISYPTEGSEDCFSIEEDSFWFKHRNNCIASIVTSHPPEDNETIFDIGGGNGFVSLGLVDAGFDVVLVEPGLIASRRARDRGLKNVVCATAGTAEFEHHSLPAIGLFDVIEHIQDDIEFLKSMKKLLKKDGYIYATVPSYSFLWSEEDISAGHYRRYTLTEISNSFKSAGFDIQFSSYIFRILPLPILLLRSLPHRLGISRGDQASSASAKGHVAKGGLARSMLNSMLRSEVKKLKQGKSMMFGSSCLVVAKNI